MIFFWHGYLVPCTWEVPLLTRTPFESGMVGSCIGLLAWGNSNQLNKHELRIFLVDYVEQALSPNSIICKIPPIADKVFHVFETEIHLEEQLDARIQLLQKGESTQSLPITAGPQPEDTLVNVNT